MSPGSANSASSSMSMMPIWAVLRRLFELLEQLVDLLQFFLDRPAPRGTVIGSRPVNSYLAASSSTWYFSPSRSTSCTSCRANCDRSSPARYQSRSRSRSCSSRDRLVETLARACAGGLIVLGRVAIARVGRLLHACRSRTSPGSCASAPRASAISASRLGPRPAIWLGSSWIARASSSSVSSRMSAVASAGARTPARPGPAAAASGWESSSGRTSGTCG